MLGKLLLEAYLEISKIEPIEQMAKQLKWKDAINHVLAEAGKPLHANAITERIVEQKLRSDLGATPAATVNATVSTSIKNEGELSPYTKVDKSTYALRETANVKVSKQPEKLTPDVDASDEEEEQYAVVSSFGMFWRRDGVEWKATPKVLGMQSIGATPVCFAQQLGIYLLYDGREVVYVGRSTDRPLGRRLYEHTIDRLSTRWDRFSWFGLLPVSEEGKLGPLPSAYNAAKLIPALESILIEALEPRQNRKRGDDLASVEYLQCIDPDIEKRKRRAVLEALAEKL